LVAEELAPLAGAAERRASRLILEMDNGLGSDQVKDIQRLLTSHPGECPVLIRVVQPGRFRLTLRTDTSIRVGPTPELTEALERVLGRGAVSYR